MTGPPQVMLLDGDHDTALQIARECAVDLDARIVGVGTDRYSRLFFSRYCDERLVLPAPDTPDYEPALLAAVDRWRPDVVLPVGFRSVEALDGIRDRLPAAVETPLPPAESLEIAVDRQKTTALATELGIDVPADLTGQIPDHATGQISDHATGQNPDDPASTRNGETRKKALEGLSFPLFLKDRRETGEARTAKVDSPAAFWSAYDDLQSNGDELIVQDYVEGDGRTYGCGLLFLGGRPRLVFCHAELRSVPRRGGSGTRVRVIADRTLERQSIALLEALDWHGVALVEYRFDDEGFVFMEINPKFWASYALASQVGYRFASTLVAALLDREPPGSHGDGRVREGRDHHERPSSGASLQGKDGSGTTTGETVLLDRSGDGTGNPSPGPIPSTVPGDSLRPSTPPTGAERVFLTREFAYCLRNRDRESLLEAGRAMLWPPARPATNVADPLPWLVPPLEMVRESGGLRAALEFLARSGRIDLPEDGPGEHRIAIPRIDDVSDSEEP